MGRKQKRREEKKVRKNVKEEEVQFFTLSGFVRTVCGVALILFLSYFILAFFVTKEYSFGSDNSKSDSSESSNTVSNQILASKIFDQEGDLYYVYFYDFNDADEKISSYLGNISETVYKVNTASGFNSKYVTSDSGNRNVKDVNDLKVKAPTLIKVSNDTVVEYYEGVTEIINAINKQVYYEN